MCKMSGTGKQIRFEMLKFRENRMKKTSKNEYRAEGKTGAACGPYGPEKAAVSKKDVFNKLVIRWNGSEVMHAIPSFIVQI